MENSTLVSISKTNKYLLYCQQCQLSHTEKWTSCTNFQGCAWHKLLREKRIYLDPPTQSQKIRKVQMQIRQITNSTALPTHPHSTRYWTLTRTPGSEQTGKDTGLSLFNRRRSAALRQKMAQPRLDKSRWQMWESQGHSYNKGLRTRLLLRVRVGLHQKEVEVNDRCFRLFLASSLSV